MWGGEAASLLRMGLLRMEKAESHILNNELPNNITYRGNTLNLAHPGGTAVMT